MHFTNAPDLIPESHRSPNAALPDPVVPETVPDPEAVNEAPVPTTRSLTRIPFAPGAPIIVSAKISDGAVSVSWTLARTAR